MSAAKLDPQVASPGPGRHRLLERERILAETLRQRGNRVVTNKQFGRQSNACSQLGIHATFGTYVDFGIAKIGIAKIGALWRC